MSWFRLVRGTLVLVALLVPVVALTGAAPTKGAKEKAGANATLVERGRYLVTVAGCNDCHTPGTLYGAPDFDRALSGSEVGWGGPWGVSYARNLTPDKETGLGAWTDQQIADAIRTGKRPDGTVLLPPMPWQMFNAFSDPDIHAVVAYLRSLPAISHKVPDKVAPGQQANTPVTAIAAPGAWDAPKGAPSASESK